MLEDINKDLHEVENFDCGILRWDMEIYIRHNLYITQLCSVIKEKTFI